MAFAMRDLVLTVISDESTNIMGERSCFNTQRPCDFVPFDHIANLEGGLDVLRQALEKTLGEVDRRIAEARRSTAT